MSLTLEELRKLGINPSEYFEGSDARKLEIEHTNKLLKMKEASAGNKLKTMGPPQVEELIRK